MEFNDERDDEGSIGPLLPPADRLWRHPSELSLAPGRFPLDPVSSFSSFAGAFDGPGNAAGWSSGPHRPAAGPGGWRSALAVVGGRFETPVWTVALVAGAVGVLLTTSLAYATGHLSRRTIAVPAIEKDVVSPAVTLAASGGWAADGFVSGAERVRSSCVVLTARDSHGSRISDGVVFRSDGMVLTSAHLVVGAQSLSALVGGSKVGARLVANDPGSDLAVVKLDGGPYEPAPLGSALDLHVGDEVMALHPPAGPGALNDVPGDQGSVSALGKGLTQGGGRLADLLEIDTGQPAQPLGAPLVDNHGAVVGITTATGADGAGLIFATPVDLAREVASQLLRSGRVTPVWLGVEGGDLPTAKARSLGVAGGAVVDRVYTGSPAALAGLRTGDIVLVVDGRPVTAMANLIMALHARQPGTSVALGVHRETQDVTLTAVLTSRPPGS